MRFDYAIPELDGKYVANNYDDPWQILLSMKGLRELRVKFIRAIFPRSAEFWMSKQARWLAPLKCFENLQVFEVYLPLRRTASLPEGVDIGCCQLYAVDFMGTPYRDYVYENGVR